MEEERVLTGTLHLAYDVSVNLFHNKAFEKRKIEVASGAWPNWPDNGVSS